MSLIHFEPFELYGSANGSTGAPAGPQALMQQRGYTYGTVSTSLVTTNTRTGSICMQAGAGNNPQWMQYAFTARTTIGCGVAMRIAQIPNTTISQELFQGIRFGTVADSFHIRVLLDVDGTIRISQAGTTRATSAPNVIVAGSYQWIEAKIVTGTGTATVEVRVNGTTVATATGLTIASITRVTLGHNGTSNAQAANYDDWIIWDNAGTENNDWMGDTFLIVAPPNADTAVNDFVPSTGTDRWALIDEAAPNDADFLTANAAGATQELSTTTPLLPVTGAVVAVASLVRALKTDTGVSTITHGIAVGGSSNVSAGINLGTGAAVYAHIAERNPDGNVAWTQTTAQAARLRMQRTA
jgi:hypothetical protein